MDEPYYTRFHGMIIMRRKEINTGVAMKLSTIAIYNKIAIIICEHNNPFNGEQNKDYQCHQSLIIVGIHHASRWRRFHFIRTFDSLILLVNPITIDVFPLVHNIFFNVFCIPAYMNGLMKQLQWDKVLKIYRSVSNASLCIMYSWRSNVP